MWKNGLRSAVFAALLAGFPPPSNGIQVDFEELYPEESSYGTMDPLSFVLDTRSWSGESETAETPICARGAAVSTGFQDLWPDTVDSDQPVDPVDWAISAMGQTAALLQATLSTGALNEAVRVGFARSALEYLAMDEELREVLQHMRRDSGVSTIAPPVAEGPADAASSPAALNGETPPPIVPLASTAGDESMPGEEKGFPLIGFLVIGFMVIVLLGGMMAQAR